MMELFRMYRQYLKLCVVVLSLAAGSAQAYTAADLIADYPFSGDANDHSGNGHHGIVNGATISTDRHGNTDSAYYFDGSSGISVSSLENYHWGDKLTVSVWYMRTGSAGYQAIVNNGYYSGSSWEIRMGAENGGTAIFTSMFAQGGDIGTLGWLDVSPPLNTWHHAVATYDGAVAKFYVDGQFIAESYGASGDLISTGQPLYIGTVNGSSNFTGFIDDVQIYGVALTSAEVADLYQGVPPQPNNTAPIAVAGASVDSNGNQQLDGSQSSDADGDALTYQWQILGEASARYGEKVLVNDLAPGTYTVTLTVSDATASSTDTINLPIAASGAKGDKGDDGNFSQIIQVTGVESACSGSSVATCPSDYTVISGGHQLANTCGCIPEYRYVINSKKSGNGWTVQMECATSQAFAMCAK
ncbi:PKD domain-containing protein [Dasania sp. GY-MA-18]|uniref:PKD domain-containing protein n=1 Tax=Dasania phycosphaerae TaxID=2950436 RepID=A0A9J6RP20_9GAMM|nr:MULTISPECIES: LamG-like jellyroll fold domain-containing protein [Dasania]MCR8923640.1 PKD domain-containing protein [Dasania sp. GY-MA-18]MCZ0866074.1 PKD domain-containing protein [Dasania phycosphaerae]MCZ0869798.1 PKD domain-containing protein [Dasania phycosphaerae]